VDSRLVALRRLTGKEKISGEVKYDYDSIGKDNDVVCDIPAGS